MKPSTVYVEKPTKARFIILFLICLITCLNYLDRANLAVAAPYLQKDLNFDPAMMGVVFSAFGWTYTLMQIPSGWLLDRWGARLMYGITIIGWSAFTFFIGLASSLTMLIIFRLGLGLFEAPAFPINARVITDWFPQSERGMAIGSYTAAEYIGLAFLTPFLAWILDRFGWQYIFFVTGVIGFIVWAVWHFIYRDPMQYKGINQAELDYIREGEVSALTPETRKVTWEKMRHLFIHRQLWGMYIGHFAVTSTLFFFMTWFPSYLVTAKGMGILKVGFYASAPFLAAIGGVLAGGKVSDWLISKGYSLSVSRKWPVIIGLLLSSTIVVANYTNDIHVVICSMSVAFFGQGVSSAVAWALLSDIAPRELVGMTGGVFNFCANLGGTISPLAVGLIVKSTNSFEAALFFVAVVALIGALSYIFIIGRPHRIEVAA